MSYVRRRFLVCFFAMFFMGSALAEDKQWQSVETVAGTVTIDVAQAKLLHAEGVPFIDVRKARQYQKRHIPGAINLYVKEDFTEQRLTQLLKEKDQPFVVYCNGTHCSLSSKAATKAVGWGFTQVKYFRSGARGWRQAGNPLEYPDGQVK